MKAGCHEKLVHFSPQLSLLFDVMVGLKIMLMRERGTSLSRVNSAGCDSSGVRPNNLSEASRISSSKSNLSFEE